LVVIIIQFIESEDLYEIIPEKNCNSWSKCRTNSQEAPKMNRLEKALLIPMSSKNKRVCYPKNPETDWVR
jgi:hypothetical protein